jgi:hypothetical protein
LGNGRRTMLTVRMPTPEVSVDRPGLISMAKEWDAQAAAMGKVAAEIDGFLSTATGAGLITETSPTGVATTAAGGGSDGLFLPVIYEYQQVCKLYGRLAEEGQQQMTGIADALIRAELSYQAVEGGLVRSSEQALG